MQTRSVTVFLGALATLATLALSACGDQPQATTPTRASATPTPTAEPTPTPTPTEEASASTPPAAAGDPVEVSLGGELPTGEAPRIAYVEGTTIHLPDGSTRLAPHEYYRFVITGDLLAGNWQDGGRSQVDLVQGGDVTTMRQSSGFVASPSGETVAWDMPNGTLMTAWDGGSVAMARDKKDAVVTAVAGAGTCFEAESEVYGCNVYYATYPDKARSVSSHGIDDFVFPEVLEVEDTTGRYAAALTSVADEGSCSALLDSKPQPAATRWETCDHTLLSFSPDGAHLLATNAYLDGPGPGRISFLDTETGAETVRIEAGQGIIADYAWEDAEHVLLVVSSPAEWRIVRVGLDGSAEELVSTTEGTDDYIRPWTLALRP